MFQPRLRLFLIGVAFFILGSAVGAGIGTLLHLHGGPARSDLGEQPPTGEEKLRRLSTANATLALCRALRPTTDPARSGKTTLTEMANPKATARCPAWVRYEAARQGLGHRIGNWMAGIQMSLIWGVPFVVGDDEIDRCGRHGCYSGAAESLGLMRGVPKLKNVIKGGAVEVQWMTPWAPGASLKLAFERNPVGDQSKCSVVHCLRQDLWFRDLTIGRWALASRMLEVRKERVSKGRREAMFGNDEEVAIAVHVRYGAGTRDRHKVRTSSPPPQFAGASVDPPPPPNEGDRRGVAEKSCDGAEGHRGEELGADEISRVHRRESVWLAVTNGKGDDPR